MKRAFCEAFLILLIAVAFGVARNSFFSNNISLFPSDKPILEVGAEKIGLAEAKRMFDEGVIFLDARGCPYYLAGHIAGARCLGLQEYDEKRAEVLADVGKDQPLVTYCDGEGCSSSLLLAEKLVNDGYTNVYVYPAGWPEWVSAGYPIEKGLGSIEGW